MVLIRNKILLKLGSEVCENNHEIIIKGSHWQCQLTK